MKRIDFLDSDSSSNHIWSLEVQIRGDRVVLVSRTPQRQDGIPWPMSPKCARELGVQLVLASRMIDKEGSEYARFLAEAEADIEAMLRSPEIRNDGS